MMTLMDRRRLMFATLNKYLPASEQTIKNLRVTAGGATIGDGVARISEIKGNSLVWNQLLNFTDASSLSDKGISVDISNNKLHVHGTKDSDASIYIDLLTRVEYIIGHRYYINCPTVSDCKFKTQIVGTNSNPQFEGPIIFTANSAGSGSVILRNGGNTGTVIDWTGYINILDLTLIFGEGKEPSTVEEFESLFPLPYYGYNPGEIINTTCAKTERVMWNQLVSSPHFQDTATSSYRNMASGFSILAGHAYLVHLSNWTNINQVRLRYPEISSNYSSDFIITPNTNGEGTLQYQGVNGEQVDTYVNVIDLTLMFGEGNEPTLQECEAIFTEDYYPYDAGTQKTLTLKDGGIESRDSNNTLIDTLHTQLTTIKGKLNGTGESVVIFPDGPARAGSVYDQVIVENNGYCRRVRKKIGRRAYQAGDESDNTLLTDGTVTAYPLATPEEYILDEPVFLGYNAQNGGTENIIPLDTQDRPAVPIIADIKYRKP